MCFLHKKCYFQKKNLKIFFFAQNVALHWGGGGLRKSRFLTKCRFLKGGGGLRPPCTILDSSYPRIWKNISISVKWIIDKKGTIKYILENHKIIDFEAVPIRNQFFEFVWPPVDKRQFLRKIFFRRGGTWRALVSSRFWVQMSEKTLFFWRFR